MPSTLPAKVDPRHRKSCAVDGETLRKKLAGHAEAGLNVGRVLERAFALAGLSKQEVAYELGYQGPSSISRWCANVEPPNLTRLWEIRQLRRALIVALAEATGGDVSVRTVLTVPTQEVA
jgi:hypothetical protein